MNDLKTWPGTSEVTDIASGTGIDITGTVIPVVNIANTTVTSGNYTYSSITVNAQGQLTAASNGAVPVLSVSGTALDISSTGGQNPILDLINTAVTPGTYNYATVTVDTKGRLTAASTGVPVTSIATGTGLTGGTITSTGTIALANTAVTAGSYSYPTLTVDAQGRLTAASNGTAPVTNITGTAGNITVTGTTTPTLNLATVGTATTLTSGSITTDAFGRVTDIVARGIIVLKSGSGTLSALPAGITRAKVTVVGGGGAGGTPTLADVAGGGGAGGTAIAYLTNLTSSTPYTVGAGNAASTFGTGTTLMTANAGSAGGVSTATLGGTGGLGGTATLGAGIGITNGVTLTGGGGGSGATVGTVGSGNGGNSSLGGGGASIASLAVTAGIAGATNTGGGGSGGVRATGAGGVGGSGVIIIEY